MRETPVNCQGHIKWDWVSRIIENFDQSRIMFEAPLEAINSSLPVVLSDIPINREILRDSKFLIDPETPEDFMDKIIQAALYNRRPANSNSR